jgi:hypothetical protein
MPMLASPTARLQLTQLRVALPSWRTRLLGRYWFAQFGRGLDCRQGVDGLPHYSSGNRS